MRKTSKGLSSLVCAAVLFTGFAPATAWADADSAFSNLKMQYPTGYSEFMEHGLTDDQLKSFLNSIISKLAGDSTVNESNFDSKLISAAKKVANQQVKDALSEMMSIQDGLDLLMGDIPPALAPVRDVVNNEWSQGKTPDGGAGGAGGEGAPLPAGDAGYAAEQGADGIVVVTFPDKDKAPLQLQLKFADSVTGYDLQLPAELISKGLQGKQALTLNIEGLGEVRVPFAKMPNRAVTLQVRPLAKNELSTPMDRNHLSLVATPLAIEVYEVANGKKAAVNWIGNDYAETRFVLPSSVSLDKLGAYRIDSATNRITPLPLTIETNQETRTAVIHHQGTATVVLGEKTDLTSFSDLKNHWAKSNIEQLTKQNMLIGYPNGTFEPEQTVSRAELVSMITRALGLSAVSRNAVSMFADVVARDWYADAVQTAVAANLVSGDGEDHFRPNDPVNRQEAAVILGRALSYLSDRLPEQQGTTHSAFADKSAISGWALDSIGMARDYKIVNGYEDNTFRPGQATTRAEAGMMIAKLLRVADLMN